LIVANKKADFSSFFHIFHRFPSIFPAFSTGHHLLPRRSRRHCLGGGRAASPGATIPGHLVEILSISAEKCHEHDDYIQCGAPQL
jgi:hypothetical protein